MSDQSLTTQHPVSLDITVGVKDESFTIHPALRMFLLVLILSISLKGIVTNIINMIVFVKLRKQDPINISLLALAFSDFIICLTTLAFFVGTTTWMIDILLLKYRINPIHVLYMTLGVPHTEAVRITLLLTALVASERCACVVFPLHIKRFITHRRIIVGVVICYILGLLDIIQIIYANRLRWVFIPGLNMTILSHVMKDDFFDVGTVLAPVKMTLFLIIPFTIVGVSTVVLIRHLKKSVAFRKTAASGTSTVTPEEGQTKETRIFRMVTIICILFIVCYIPNIAFLALVSFTADNNLQYSDRHHTQIIFYSGFLFDTINSSVNIWIYYFNSSNYKKVFKTTFSLKRES